MHSEKIIPVFNEVSLVTKSVSCAEVFAIRRCTLTCSTDQAPLCELLEHWPRRSTACARKGACRPRWRSAAAPGVAQKVGRPCRLSGCCNAVMYARACTHARAAGGQASTVLPQVPPRRPEGGPGRSMNPRRGAVFRVRATSLSFVPAQGARGLRTRLGRLLFGCSTALPLYYE